jgi:hypothetical protein
MKLPFIRAMEGKGFRAQKTDGTISLRNTPPAINYSSPPPQRMVSNGCPKCQDQSVVKYRCSPALQCTHAPGFHVICTKCGEFLQPEA